MARLQLYGKKDVRLNKTAVKTSYTSNLLRWKVIAIISIISNIYLLLDKLFL